MTYCVAMNVEDGIVGLSDTLITSGREVTTLRKVNVYSPPRGTFFVMTSGLRSLRDKTLTYFEDRLAERASRDVPFERLYQAVNLLAEQVRTVAHEDKASLHESGMAFNIHVLIGGQMERDARQKLYLLYPEGNWVDTGRLTPYHVIGSVGYGKPLLDRTLRVEDSMRHAFKVACLSFDSTRISAADVDFPIDVVLYRRNSFRIIERRFPQAGSRAVVALVGRAHPARHRGDAERAARPGLRRDRDRPAGAGLHRLVRITVRHRTSYAFDTPVYLEPHVIRLRPRDDGSVRLVEFTLRIDPEPVVRTDNLDPEGNVLTHAWFEGQWSRLTLRTHAVVDTLLADPFGFLITEPERPLPYAYAPDFCERLALYRRPPDAAHPSVRELALAAATASERDPARFPLALAGRIRAEFVRETRPEGPPRAPEATIRARPRRLPRSGGALRRLLPGHGTRGALRQRLCLQ